jgi:hypothetical protein
MSSSFRLIILLLLASFWGMLPWLEEPLLSSALGLVCSGVLPTAVGWKASGWTCSSVISLSFCSCGLMMFKNGLYPGLSRGKKISSHLPNSKDLVEHYK